MKPFTYLLFESVFHKTFEHRKLQKSSLHIQLRLRTPPPTYYFKLRVKQFFTKKLKMGNDIPIISNFSSDSFSQKI